MDYDGSVVGGGETTQAVLAPRRVCTGSHC